MGNTSLKDFNWKRYLKKYTDLLKNGIDSKEKAYRQWIRFGYKENRKFYTVDDPAESGDEIEEPESPKEIVITFKNFEHNRRDQNPT